MNFESLDIAKLLHSPVDGNLARISRHIERYHIALKSLDIDERDFVIDASCGYGYGSYILRQKARKVYGLDINEKYLDSAKENFNVDMLHFSDYKTYENLTRFIEKADKIICIETFEHIEKDKICQFIELLLYFIKRDGSMFITVPLGNNKPCNRNKYHLNEPSIDFLYDLFVDRFKKINFNIFEKKSFEQLKKECYLTLKHKI